MIKKIIKKGENTMKNLNLTTMFMSIEQSFMFECESIIFSSCSISSEQNLKVNGINSLNKIIS